MLPISKLQPIRLLSLRLIAAGALSLLLTQPTLVAAQVQQAELANPARITQPVDDTILTTLKGNVHPLAKPQFDKGPANASLPADRMQLVLKRSSGQEIALRQFLGSLQNPNSAQYRKWLTPEQFGAQYGVSDTDIQTISTWLISQGFKINKVNKARTIIDFSGTVGQLQSGFHTQIHSYSVNGEQHLANASDPRIPTALAPVVAGISRLNDFFPKAESTKASPGKLDKATGKLVPELTLGSASQGYALYVVPGDAATIYDAPNSMNANFHGSTAYTGSNVTIGIVGYSNINVSTVNTYRSVFGLPSQSPTVVVDGNDPGTNSALDEAYLDLEISGALAPGASQIYYVAASTNLDDGLSLAINRALDDNSVSILSASYGQCEITNGSSGNTLYYNYWEQAAAQGISVTVSTGDSGSASCDDQNTETQAVNGLQVSGLASTPFNIAVGGTDFDVLGTTFTQYVSTTNPSNYQTALGFIPEEPWNDSTNVNGMVSANVPYTDTSGATNIIAAGGGASSCVDPAFDANGNFLGCNTTTGNLTGWPKPSWQTGGNLNIPSDGVRDLPDVSLFASNGFYNATWLVCTDDVDSNGITHNCSNVSGSFYFEGIGGTSASTPAFAGILALVSQSQGEARLGQANYVLYNLANQGSLYSTAFHDVTTGNNSVYCSPGSTNCGSNDFLSGYDTGAGFDLASGLGSVDIAQLITAWPQAVFTPTTTTFTLSPVNITHGQAVTLDATVAGAAGTPSGDVAIVTNANQATSASNSNSFGFVTLSGGTTGSVSFSNLPGGTYNVFAYYGGDINYAQSQSPPVQVTVAKENSVVSLFGASNPSTTFTLSGPYPYGTYFSVEAQPVGVSQEISTSPASATGTVTFSDTAGLPAGVSPTVNINSGGYAELPVYFFGTASHSISASYSGDNSFNASTATATFTITPAPTSSTVSATPTTVSGGTFAVTSLIVPNPISGATSPTGTVSLTVNGTMIGSGTVVAYQDPSTGASEANVTITANATSLAAGANTITATYSGDTNYTASSNTVVVTSTPAAPSFALTNTAATVSSPGQTGTSTVTVTPSAGYIGTVNLTCALTTAPSGANATYNPTCSLSAASVKITSSTAGTATASFATTAPTTGALVYPAINQKPNRWYSAAGGAALACIVFFGIPARRRGWRSMLGLVVFLITMAGVGCGGGGTTTNPGTPGTTTGTYTFTVTGTDSVTSTTTENTVVTVTVN